MLRRRVQNYLNDRYRNKTDKHIVEEGAEWGANLVNNPITPHFPTDSKTPPPLNPQSPPSTLLSSDR